MRFSRHVELAAERFFAGDLDAASELVDLGLQLYPYHPVLHEIRSEIVKATAGERAYADYLEKWQRANPWLAEIAFRRGCIALRAGDVALAASSFDQGLSLVESATETRKLKYGTVSRARLKHDFEQLAFLCSAGILRYDAYRDVLLAYQKLTEKYFANQDNQGLIELQDEELGDISPFYRRCLFIYDEAQDDMFSSECVDENSLFGRNHEWSVLKDKLDDVGFVVIDDFLSQGAFESLRKYFLFSTVFHNDAQKGLSYVGAYQDTGGESRTAGLVAEEVRKRLDLPSLSQVWAYKNVFGATAIGAHADFAEVNVNFWLTPDRYAKTENGGLRIYRAEAPSEWKFDNYNDDDQRIVSFLQGRDFVDVSYRCNRGVIFRGALFHASGVCAFEDCYEGHRINFTMLFGDRSAK